jgi:hypothetical protein
LRNPAFRVFIFASLVTIIGFWGFSISSYDKGGAFPVLLFLSEVLIALGGIVALISFLICLAMGFGAVIHRLVSRNKHTIL